MKKEFRGPGLHLRPVRAGRERPPPPVDSELSAQRLWERQWKDKTPCGQGNLEDHIQATRRLRENIP